MASTEAQVATLLTIASDAHAQPKQRLEALNAFEQLVEGRGDLVEHQTTVALSFVSVPNPDIQKWAVGFIEYMVARSPISWEQRESRILYCGNS